MLLFPFGDVGFVAHVDGDIARRADSHIHGLSVGREGHIAGPMTATDRQIADHRLRRARRLHVARLVSEADDFSFKADINPLWLRSRRIKGDAIGVLQALRKRLGRLGPVARLRRADDSDLAFRSALGDENIAVRRDADDTGALQSGGEGLNLEPGHGMQLRVIGLRHDFGAVRRRGRRQRRGDILRSDFPHQTRRVGAPVAEGGSAAPVIKRCRRAYASQ